MHARRFGPDRHHGRLVPIGIVVGTHECYLQMVDQNLAAPPLAPAERFCLYSGRQLINFVVGGAADCTHANSAYAEGCRQASTARTGLPARLARTARRDRRVRRATTQRSLARSVRPVLPERLRS